MFTKIKFVVKRIFSIILFTYLALFVIVLISEGVNCITSSNLHSSVTYGAEREGYFQFEGFALPEWTRCNPTEDWNCPAEWTTIDWEKVWSTSW